MARLTRWTQKVFASSASNNGVFGSGADGTKVLSNALDVIQSKAAWLLGWTSAVIGTKKFPPLEEFQAMDYLTTYQIGYILQDGIPEFDIGTTYYANSIVKKPGTYELYGSIGGPNVGNALPAAVSDANWSFLTNLSASYAQATESVSGILKIASVAQVKAGTDDATAVTPLKLAPYIPQTGMVYEHSLSTLPTGFVWANSLSVGNAASNATQRANADTMTLFFAYWNDPTRQYAGTTAVASQGQLQVYDSTGAPVARGVSATADWNANRSIAVIDRRGRVAAGKDNMGGATAAGRLSGQTFGVNGTILGAAGGQETHQLTATELPVAGYGIGGTTLYATSPVGSIGSANTHGGGSVPGWNVQPTTAGYDSPHNVVQPTMISNFIIKL